MDEELISETLEALSTREHAKKRGKHVRTLRGVRGVPDGEVARVATAAWLETRPTPSDSDALTALFGTAFEDGLVAIGLLAAMVPDSPEDAYDLGLEWLERIDDVNTADALGWLVLGPGALATGELKDLLSRARQSGSHNVRRAVVAAAFAMTPALVTGPAAAPLRARLGVKTVRFMDSAQSDWLTVWADAFLRDEAPAVRKAMRRLLREWTGSDPKAVVEWADAVRGGLPKMLRAEVDRARRKAK
jgi:hypothetical protein